MIVMNSNQLGRRKMDLSIEESTQEEGTIRPLVVMNQEIGTRLRSQIAKVEERTGAELWSARIEELKSSFVRYRSEFLSILEAQPGFLQSTFLSLHRKLRQQYR